MADNNTNPKVTNALDVFNAIPDKHTSETEIVGAPHTDVVESHVQGVARRGNRYLLTHSHVHADAALLLDVDDTQAAQVVPLPVPPVQGAVLNHAGGCQLIGDYLVIPFEAVNDDVSRVSFFDVTKPGRPVELARPAPIVRNDHKAGAAGVASITEGGSEVWYLAVYDNGRLDVLRSDGNAFPATEFSPLFTFSLPNGYESLCLFADQSNALFAIGFRLDSLARDKADLYRVHLDSQSLELLESKHCVTNGLRDIHFRWGAGLDIRSAADMALLATERNFLPLGLGEAAGAAGSQANAAEAALLTLRCHLDTFSAS